MKKFIFILSCFSSLFAMGATIPTDTYLNLPLNGTIVDVSANAFTNSLTGTLTPTTDRHGVASGALQFDGATVITIGATEAIGTTDFTVSYWAYTDAANTGYVFTKEKSGVAANQFKMGYKDTYANCFSDNTNAQGGSISYTPTANVWTYYTVVRSSNVISLYVNGVFQNKLTTTSVINHANTLAYKIAGRESGTDMFKGKIDDLRMYKRALSTDEITALYNEKYLIVTATGANLTSDNSNATTINITSNATWTAVSSDSWLTVSPSVATTGSATLNLSATAITSGTDDRTATITISGANIVTRQIRVTQTNPAATTVIWENSVAPAITGGMSANGINPLAQQFIVTSANTSIQEIKLYVCRYDNLADYTVSIYNDNGSNQIGTKVTDIYSGNTSSLLYVGLSELIINSANCINNALPLTLETEKKYWIVIYTASSFAFVWWYDKTNAAINGIGASNYSTAGVSYSTKQPFFMKITANVAVVTALNKITSDEVSVEAVAKTMSINSVFENYTVDLFTISGAKVLTQQVTQSGSTTIATDVTSGIYFVKISAEGRSFTKKVFLQ